MTSLLFKAGDDRADWAPEWHPIEKLNRKVDNTYLVRVEAVPGSAAIGRGWIDKAYFDGFMWASDDGRKIERAGVWKITAFASWPELDQTPTPAALKARAETESSHEHD